MENVITSTSSESYGNRQTSTSEENQNPWEKIVGWSLLIPVATLFAFTFLYYHELGAFTAAKIPIEFIQLDILDTIPHLAISIASGMLFWKLFLDARKEKFFSLHNYINITGNLIIVVAIPVSFSLGVYRLIALLLVYFLSIILIYHKRIPNNYKSGAQILGSLLISFALLSFFAFYYGVIERGISREGMLQKKGQSQILFRKYSAYSIYYIPDTTKLTGKLIVIQYSPSEADTLVQFKEYLIFKKRHGEDRPLEPPQKP